MTADADKTNDVVSRFDPAAAQWDSNPGRIALARAVAGEIKKTIPMQAGFTSTKICDAHQIDRDGRQYSVFLATGSVGI